jgi:hypothetical protein
MDSDTVTGKPLTLESRPLELKLEGNTMHCLPNAIL